MESEIHTQNSVLLEKLKTYLFKTLIRGKGLVVTWWSNLAVVVWPSHVVMSLWCRVRCVVVRGSGRVLSCAAVVPWLLHGHVVVLWLWLVVGGEGG